MRAKLSRGGQRSAGGWPVADLWGIGVGVGVGAWWCVVVVGRTGGGMAVAGGTAACLLAQLAEDELVMYTFIRAVV